MDDDDKDHYREAHRSYFDSCAGDDLTRMASYLSDLRDFLIGLIGSNAKPDEDAISRMAQAEEAVQALFAARWQECQQAMEHATDKELDETDTTWMGKRMPSHFAGMTVETLRGLLAKSRQPRTPTNPATLISTGKLDA